MTLSIFPPEASRQAYNVDLIFLSLCAVSVVIVLGVFITGTVFAIRYRRGSPAPRGELPEWINREFEITWTVGTFFAFVFIFWFAGATFLAEYKAPPDAEEIHVVGKQWMWKIEHPTVRAKSTRLHVPIERPDPARDDLAGRHPLVLPAGAAHQAGRRPRTLYDDRLQGRQGRHLQSALRRILRRAAIRRWAAGW